MYIIENDLLVVKIQARGAELTSIYHKEMELEYMWEGDPTFWSKHSPVLFPIVGGLKNNTYFYNNRAYQLPRHGFAREKEFSVTEESSNRITFHLGHDEETLLVYPFQFGLKIIYTLSENDLTVSYEVKNLQNDELYFSLGAHPAFKIPLLRNTSYEDYYLEFNHKENSPSWPVSPDGLIEEEPIPFLKNDSTITLQKELFLHDALVFKDLQSHSVSLKSTKHAHGLDVDFKGFPYMGIWAAKNADFVCIEPWCGIADSVQADQQIKNKEGINKLEKGESFKRQWKLALR
ncbi:MAG: aldose 1-epimerase family protein [Chitinophagaceae bacterium]|nr:aldose 1-epimerase family protein [Chitinophagaceae bacterium]